MKQETNKGKKHRKTVLIVTCACLCLAVVAWLYYVFFYPYRPLGPEGDARYYQNHIISQKTGKEINSVYDNFVIITVNGVKYKNPTKQDITHYELGAAYYSEKKRQVVEKAKDAKSDQFYFIRQDIGKKMGVVEESNYEFLKGLNAFYYSCFPEDDGICILKMKDGFGYQMFTRMPVEDKPEEVQATAITEEQALEAIKNYCILQNPQLKEMMESGDQSFYWASTMNEKGEIVILYRSYTAAQIRYYIDPNTGDTYVTEFVPGITDEEERTEETFNIKDYM